MGSCGTNEVMGHRDDEDENDADKRGGDEEDVDEDEDANEELAEREEVAEGVVALPNIFSSSSCNFRLLLPSPRTMFDEDAEEADVELEDELSERLTKDDDGGN